MLRQLETADWVTMFLRDATTYCTHRTLMFETMLACSTRGEQRLAERCWAVTKKINFALLAFTDQAKTFIMLGGGKRGPVRLASSCLKD